MPKIMEIELARPPGLKLYLHPNPVVAIVEVINPSLVFGSVKTVNHIEIE
jgi:hypothetical protein